ncbi:MAG: M28 family peptidase [Caldilineaceae bacterium]|nr:M28 family peptidase [Caldilineaceae bacterium]
MGSLIRSIRAYTIEISLLLALLASLGFFGYLGYGLIQPSPDTIIFSGEEALGYVKTQLEFGPRVTGSEAHKQMGDWAIRELSERGWEVFIQPFEPLETVDARNILAVNGSGPAVIIAAHYDSRMFADADPNPDNWTQPVPGANDGASGVAVLMELARSLDVAASGKTICLVLFDAEDNGRIPGWDWILGSRFFVSRLSALPKCSEPEFAVVVDMIGDADQQVYREGNSTPFLVDAIWTTAAELGYGEWIVDAPRHSMLDDHTPFLEAGIPAVDMIDFDYPFWHTVDDTLDKVSAESLARIGRTLEVWLERGAPYSRTN